ncbi:MAG: sodium:calcium antiporter [Armatimonadota bacterium]
MTYLYLVIDLFLIFLAAELFTNAIEWLGKRLKLAEGAVGSVLAAVGTALPETTIAAIAVLGHDELHTEAGIGAILGAPMMLSTLAMFITGFAILLFSAAKIRKPEVSANFIVVKRDLSTFFLVYLLALSAALIPMREIKLIIGAVLVFIYIYYVKRTFSCSCTMDEEECRPLHFTKNSIQPRLRWVLVQICAGLALMIFGADEFIKHVTEISLHLGVSPLVLSVIITPIATELPEKFNSITWVRHRKDTLALGNITGAMVFQSSILPAIGITFTHWHLDSNGIACIIIALLASGIAWVDITIRKKLSPYSMLTGGALYLLYPIWVFWLSKIIIK